MNKNSFIFIEKYKFNEFENNMTLPVIIKISDYLQILGSQLRVIQFRKLIVESFKGKAKDEKVQVILFFFKQTDYQ